MDLSLWTDGRLSDKINTFGYLEIQGGEKDEWEKLAVISPDEGAAKAPIVHLANDGGHYMPLIQENFKKSNKDHLQGKKFGNPLV